MSGALAEAKAEIEALHAFFAGWFTGSLPDTNAVFEKGLASRLHPDFEIVFPSGAVRNAPEILGGMRGAWGSNPDFRVEVGEVRLLGDWPEAGLVLAGFVETQSGARNTTPPENTRRSTVLFERRDGCLLWRHVHETGLDQGNS